MGFSIKSVLRFGWETFKKRPWLFVAAILLIFVVQVLVEVLYRAAIILLFVASEDFGSGVGFLFSTLLYYALTTLISMGVTALFLAAHDNAEAIKLTALWHPHLFWKYLGVTVFFILAALAGFALMLFFSAALGPIIGRELGARAAVLLVIVLGTIVWLMFMFSPFFVIDREAGPIEALNQSYRITSGHKWSLFGLLLLLALINLLGPLAFIIGYLLPGFVHALLLIVAVVTLLVTVPVTLLAITHAYRVLSGTTGAWPDEAMDAKLAAVTRAAPRQLTKCLRGKACYSAGSSGRSALSASAALRGLR